MHAQGDERQERVLWRSARVERLTHHRAHPAHIVDVEGETEPAVERLTERHHSLTKKQSLETSRRTEHGHGGRPDDEPLGARLWRNDPDVRQLRQPEHHRQALASHVGRVLLDGQRIALRQRVGAQLHKVVLVHAMRRHHARLEVVSHVEREEDERPVEIERAVE